MHTFLKQLSDKRQAGLPCALDARTDYSMNTAFPINIAKNILDSREIALLMFALKSDISDTAGDIIEIRAQGFGRSG